MPKVVKKVVKRSASITLELNVSAPGAYDTGYFFSGARKIGQLTLVRCEESKKVVQLLQSSGIVVEVQ